jgi:DNA-binding CsgD family transcriptional regulator
LIRLEPKDQNPLVKIHKTFFWRIEKSLESNDPKYLDELYHSLPADILHINDKETFALKYVDPSTLKMIGVRPEELIEKGGELIAQRVKPESFERNLPILQEFVARGNPHEIGVIFQEINTGSLEKKEYEWFVSFMKLSEVADGIITLEFKVDFLEQYQKKFMKVIEWDEFVHKNMEKFQSLSQREVEILSNVGLGKSSQEISEELHISKLTVDTHRKNLMQKLDVKRFPDLIRFAEAFDLV